MFFVVFFFLYLFLISRARSYIFEVCKYCIRSLVAINAEVTYGNAVVCVCFFFFAFFVRVNGNFVYTYVHTRCEKKSKTIIHLPKR